MAHPQYKTSAGGAAADVPAASLGHFGEGGNGPVILDPEATEQTVSGLPCGAVGRPTLELAVETMTGAGLDFWQDLFASRAATYVQLWLEAWDPRTNAWSWWTGYLQRPAIQGVEPGATAAATVFRGVTIRLVEAQAA